MTVNPTDLRPEGIEPVPVAPVLQVDHCWKSYGQGAGEMHALCDVSLLVHPGETLAIVGPSGSGKSTLLNLMAALDTPSRGRVLFDGVDMMAMSDARKADLRRRRLAMVFQSFNLLPTLRAGENVELPGHLVSRPPRETRIEALKLLDAVGLRDRANAWPDTLSGGELQRVAIARALMNRPDVLLADEPTGNLDSANAERVLDLLFALARERGAALALVTHSPEAAACAGRVVTMRDGRIVS